MLRLFKATNQLLIFTCLNLEILNQSRERDYARRCLNFPCLWLDDFIPLLVNVLRYSKFHLNFDFIDALVDGNVGDDNRLPILRRCYGTSSILPLVMVRGILNRW